MSKDQDVAEKLSKVAASLESATSRLNDIAHQQNFEMIKERLTKSEKEISKLRDQFMSSLEKGRASRESVEKDFSGLRALVFSSFVLSVICLAGIIILSTKF